MVCGWQCTGLQPWRGALQPFVVIASPHLCSAGQSAKDAFAIDLADTLAGEMLRRRYTATHYQQLLATLRGIEAERQQASALAQEAQDAYRRLVARKVLADHAVAGVQRRLLQQSLSDAIPYLVLVFQEALMKEWQGRVDSMRARQQANAMPLRQLAQGVAYLVQGMMQRLWLTMLQHSNLQSASWSCT